MREGSSLYIMMRDNVKNRMSIKGTMRMIFTIVAIMVIIVCVLKPLDLGQLPPREDLEILEGFIDSKNYLVFSPKCRIPAIQPWDKSIRSYFKRAPLLHCSKRPLLTSIVNLKNGTYILKIEQTAISSYKESKTDNITCCYSEVTRVSEKIQDYDEEADNKIRYSKCREFEYEEVLPNTTEFIKVRCELHRKKKPNKEVYRDAHAVVPILPSALKKKRLIEEKRFLDKYSSKLNVLILGIDSVSRLNIRRMMPETYEYLKRNNWIEMNGYTKIAENTFPNLMAILSGRDLRDIRQSCYHNNKNKVDDCPFIWKEFSDLGYITAYAEDTPNISTFNYLKTGFLDKPTDYYLRPFMLATHSALTKRKIYGLPVCVGPVAPVDHILNYARRFLETFNDSNHFSLYWMNSLSHNNPNMAGNMDHRIYKFFLDLVSIGTYNNTVIFFLSDHGPRFGDFRHSFIGYYEERLPFFFMWFPEWFRTEYPSIYGNIVMNQKRLTCPFDVHLTLMKIMKGYFQEGKQVKTLSVCPKCVSLFDPMPWNRGCEDAAIIEAWCMCNDFEKISIFEPIVKKLGLFVKENVDKKTKELIKKHNLNSSICANWKFNKVIRTHEIISRTHKTEYNDLLRKRREYMVLVELNPGKTKFEAVIEVTSLGGDEQQLKILSAPSRLDGYSKYSNCVKTSDLKYYCYCAKL